MSHVPIARVLPSRLQPSTFELTPAELSKDTMCATAQGVCPPYSAQKRHVGFPVCRARIKVTTASFLKQVTPAPSTLARGQRGGGWPLPETEVTSQGTGHVFLPETSCTIRWRQDPNKTQVPLLHKQAFPGNTISRSEARTVSPEQHSC